MLPSKGRLGIKEKINEEWHTELIGDRNLDEPVRETNYLESFEIATQRKR